MCTKPIHLGFLLHTARLNSNYAAAAKSLQLSPTLCDPIDCSPPGSSVRGIFRQECWSGLPCSPPNLPDPGIKPTSLVSPELVGGFFTTGTPWKAQFQLHAVLIYPKVTTTFRSLCNSSL